MRMFLHFIPARDLANRHHGTYKDVITRVEWLQAHVAEYRQVLVHGDNPAAVDKALAAGGALTGALVEYSYYPNLVKRLKQRVPAARVAVRAINIEPLQHFDNAGGWRCQRGPLWLLYGMARLMRHDWISRRTADVILSINAWENRVYWSHLPGRARVEWLPYRCPDHLLPVNPLPYGQRRVIACLPTSHKNRKSWDLVTRFQRLAVEMKRLGCRDEFVITGNLRDWNLPPCAVAAQIGFVEDLSVFAGTCKAVALLSPLGYGFKTTIADALACGAHVLAHPALAQRCPDVVREHLVSVDSHAEASTAAAMQRLERPPQAAALHDDLKATAEAVMRRWLL